MRQIKKTLSLLLTFLLLIGAIPLQSIVAAETFGFDLWISNNTLKYNNQNLEGSLNINVYNNNQITTPAIIVCSIMDDKNTTIATQTKSVHFDQSTSSISEQMSFSIPVSTTYGHKVKAMLWNNATEMVPLALAAVNDITLGGQIKLAGIITDNEYSNYKEGCVTIKVTDNYNYSKYAIGDSIFLNVGDTKANDYVGRKVIVFANHETSSSTYPTITSITDDSIAKVTVQLENLKSAVMQGDNVLVEYFTDKENGLTNKIYIPESSDTLRTYVNGVRQFGYGGYDVINNLDSGDYYIEREGTIEFVSTTTEGAYDYDTILISVYQNFIVDSVDTVAKKIYASVDTPYGAILSFDPNDLTVKITIIDQNGNAVDPKDLKQYDVLSIQTNFPFGSPNDVNKEIYNCTLVRNAITGMITEISYESPPHYYVNGKAYMLDPDADLNLDLQDKGTFYLDMLGKIVTFKPDLVGSNYALFVNAVENDFSGYRLKLYSADGKMIIKDLAPKVKWAYDNYKVTLDDEDVPATYNSQDYAGKVCTYEVNSSDQINALIFSTPTTTADNNGYLAPNDTAYKNDLLQTNINNAAASEILVENTDYPRIKTYIASGTKTVYLAKDAKIIVAHSDGDWMTAPSGNFGVWNMADIKINQSLNVPVSVYDIDPDTNEAHFVFINGNVELKEVSLSSRYAIFLNALDDASGGYTAKLYTAKGKTITKNLAAYVTWTDGNQKISVSSAALPAVTNLQDYAGKACIYQENSYGQINELIFSEVNTTAEENGYLAPNDDAFDNQWLQTNINNASLFELIVEDAGQPKINVAIASGTKTVSLAQDAKIIVAYSNGDWTAAPDTHFSAWNIADITMNQSFNLPVSVYDVEADTNEAHLVFINGNVSLGNASLSAEYAMFIDSAVGTFNSQVKLYSAGSNMIVKDLAPAIKWADGNMIIMADAKDIPAITQKQSYIGKFCTYHENSNGEIDSLIFSTPVTTATDGEYLAPNAAAYKNGVLQTNINNASPAELIVENTPQPAIQVTTASGIKAVSLAQDARIIVSPYDGDWLRAVNSDFAVWNITDITENKPLNASVSVYDIDPNSNEARCVFIHGDVGIEQESSPPAYAVFIDSAAMPLSGYQVKLYSATNHMIVKTLASSVKWAEGDTIITVDDEDVPAITQYQNFTGKVCTYRENSRGEIDSLIFSTPMTTAAQYGYLAPNDTALQNHLLQTNINNAASSELVVDSTDRPIINAVTSNGEQSVYLADDAKIIVAYSNGDWTTAPDSNFSIWNIAYIKENQSFNAPVSVYDVESNTNEAHLIFINGNVTPNTTAGVSLVRTLSEAINSQGSTVLKFRVITNNNYPVVDENSNTKAFTLAEDNTVLGPDAIQGSIVLAKSRNSLDEVNRLSVLTAMDSNGKFVKTDALNEEFDSNSDVSYSFGHITNKVSTIVYFDDVLSGSSETINISSSSKVMIYDTRRTCSSRVYEGSIGDIQFDSNGNITANDVSSYDIFVREYKGAIQDVVLYIYGN